MRHVTEEPRTRPERGDNVRDTLLECGLATFVRQGYHGTGIKEIVRQAGVPKGSFYNYFDSKEAFGAAVIDRYAGRIHGRLDEMVQAPGDPLDRLKDFFRTQLRTHKERGSGCLIGNLGAEFGGDSEVMRRALARGVEGIRERFGRLIALAQERGTARSDIAPERLGGLLFSAWEGALVQMQVEGDARAARECCDLLLDGFFRP
ncbi:MAG: TetR/AcrR family transcriptional regulator [Gemmatimonadota bacterium]